MIGYTGISFPFRFSGSGSVSTSTTSMDDFSHIQESLIQIILTAIGEREFETSFGSEVNKQMFKVYDDESELAVLKFYITQAIEKWESRVSIDDVIFEPMEDDDGNTALQCTVSYEVVRYMANDSVTLNLEL
jgi:phage baseplate assembly protein W